jgi:hypothetical protein
MQAAAAFMAVEVFTVAVEEAMAEVAAIAEPLP